MIGSFPRHNVLSPTLVTIVEAPATVAHLIGVVHKSHGGNRYCIDAAVCAGESKRGKGRKGRIEGKSRLESKGGIGDICAGEVELYRRIL